MKNRKRILLPALALALILTAGIGSAGAYFSTYAKARGGIVMELGSRREFREEFSNWTKTLTVTNNADSKDSIFVRARVFYPETLYLGQDRTEVNLVCDTSGEGWSGPDNDYYYYSYPVAPGAATNPLNVHIQGMPAQDSPLYAELQEGDMFSVIVVYESIPVSYGPDGQPIDPAEADWSRTLDTGTTEGGLEP